MSEEQNKGKEESLSQDIEAAKSNEESGTTLIRVSPKAKKEYNRISKQYDIPQSTVAEAGALLIEDHVLRRDYINLPALTNEVINLEHRTSMILSQAELLEDICQMLIATSIEAQGVS